MRIKRFFYVRSPKGRVRHIQYGKSHSEGLVACGKYSEKGWLWCQSKNHEGFIPVCEKCIDAAERDDVRINVERVRMVA